MKRRTGDARFVGASPGPRGKKRARAVTEAELPDVRDGLTSLERAVLVTLAECQREHPGRPVPTALLYGRLSERVDLRPDELMALLARLARR